MTVILIYRLLDLLLVMGINNAVWDITIEAREKDHHHYSLKFFVIRLNLILQPLQLTWCSLCDFISMHVIQQAGLYLCLSVCSVNFFVPFQSHWFISHMTEFKSVIDEWWLVESIVSTNHHDSMILSVNTVTWLRVVSSVEILNDTAPHRTAQHNKTLKEILSNHAEETLTNKLSSFFKVNSKAKYILLIG